MLATEIRLNERRTQSERISEIKFFSYKEYKLDDFPTPWKAAFPNSEALGYWEVFCKRCSNISGSSNGVVDEQTAKNVWMGILSEYEAYQRMGMWLPDQVMDEHRQVAAALGWYPKSE